MAILLNPIDMPVSEALRITGTGLVIPDVLSVVKKASPGYSQSRISVVETGELQNAFGCAFTSFNKGKLMPEV